MYITYCILNTSGLRIYCSTWPNITWLWTYHGVCKLRLVDNWYQLLTDLFYRLKLSLTCTLVQTLCLGSYVCTTSFSEFLSCSLLLYVHMYVCTCTGTHQSGYIMCIGPAGVLWWCTRCYSRASKEEENWSQRTQGHSCKYCFTCSYFFAYSVLSCLHNYVFINCVCVCTTAAHQLCLCVYHCCSSTVSVCVPLLLINCVCVYVLAVPLLLIKWHSVYASYTCGFIQAYVYMCVAEEIQYEYLN